jgi:hypothetical protein
MTMYAQIGSYTFDAGTVAVSSHSMQKRYNSRGRAQSKIERLVLEGTLIASTQSAIRAKIDALKTACEVDGVSAGLRHSNGSVSSHWLNNVGSVSGVQIVGWDFPESAGNAEYATGRSFTIALQAEYLISDLDPLVCWQETITVIGNGGPRFVPIETDNSAVLMQTVSLATPIYVEQRGQAIGSVAYPDPPTLLNTAGLVLDNPNITTQRGSPRQSGQSFVDWPISWFYRYFSASQVDPFPEAR